MTTKRRRGATGGATATSSGLSVTTESTALRVLAAGRSLPALALSEACRPPETRRMRTTRSMSATWRLESLCITYVRGRESATLATGFANDQPWRERERR